MAYRQKRFRKQHIRSVLQTIDEENEDDMADFEQVRQPLIWSCYPVNVPWWILCCDAFIACLDADCFMSFEA